MTQEIQKLILQTYGSKAHFAQRMKVSRLTGYKYFSNPEKMPFGHFIKLCKHAKIDVKTFINKSIEEDIYE